MNLELKSILLDDIPKNLLIAGQEAGLLFTESTEMKLLLLDGVPVGYCGICYKPRVMLKCEYVLPEHRRKGLLKYMIIQRLAEIKFKRGKRTAEANCTPLSLSVHIGCGAVEHKVFKNGITQVVYENL